MQQGCTARVGGVSVVAAGLCKAVGVSDWATPASCPTSSIPLVPPTAPSPLAAVPISKPASSRLHQALTFNTLQSSSFELEAVQMRLNLVLLLISCLVLSTSAQGFRQKLRRAEPSDGDKHDSKDQKGSQGSGKERKEGGKSNGNGNNGSSNGSGSSSQTYTPAAGAAVENTISGGAISGGATAMAASAGATGAQTPTSAWSSSSGAAATGSTTATSSSSAAVTSQSTRVVQGKINMTLAEMPYKQVMCKNNSEVQSGSFINATWLIKGSYTSTVYLRYGIDGYAAWNTVAGGTLPPFSGHKVNESLSDESNSDKKQAKPSGKKEKNGDDKKQASPSKKEGDSHPKSDGEHKKQDSAKRDDLYGDPNQKGMDGSQDVNATYRVTFQTQVFSYQQGVIFTILLYDNQKNVNVVTLESAQIAIKGVCEQKKQELKESSSASAAGYTESDKEDDKDDDDDESDNVSASSVSASISSSSASSTPTIPPPRSSASLRLSLGKLTLSLAVASVAIWVCF